MSDIDLNFRPEDYFQNKENNEINMPLVSQTGFLTVENISLNHPQRK